MGSSENSLIPPPSGSPHDDLAALLGPGALTLDPEGNVSFADPRALELLGCADGFELERLWEELRGRLQSAGLSWNGAGGSAHWAVLDLCAAAGTSTSGEAETEPARRVLFDWRRDPASGGILLVQDFAALAGLETDLRLTSQMRSVAQISPAVAHDLRAPINAMVFNIELLKEMVVSGRAADPGSNPKLLRYVNVLKEELSRLHRGLEIFLAYVSPRSDKIEALDLRELVEELASLLVAPARKQQVQVKAELPEEPVVAEGNRYLLRQALLHVVLAALAEAPKQATLHLRLERLDDRARLRAYGVSGGEGAAANPQTPAPDFDLHFSSGGAAAQLWVARSILAAHGGEARVSDPDAGSPRAYEVELTLPGDQSTRKD